MSSIITSNSGFGSNAKDPPTNIKEENEKET